MSEYLDYLSQFDVYSLDDVQEDMACLTEHCLDIDGDAWKLEPVLDFF